MYLYAVNSPSQPGWGLNRGVDPAGEYPPENDKRISEAPLRRHHQDPLTKPGQEHTQAARHRAPRTAILGASHSQLPSVNHALHSTDLALAPSRPYECQRQSRPTQKLPHFAPSR